MPGHPAFVIPLAAAWSLAALSVVFWIIAATRFEPLRRDPPTVRRGRHMLPPSGGWRRAISAWNWTVFHSTTRNPSR